MDNLFQRATREAFRFASIKGELTTEQLWTLPLQSKSGLDLDNVAKAANADVKEAAEESFVQQASPRNDLAVAKLEVVKAVISVKMAENLEAKKRVDNAAMRQRLVEILEQKQSQELLQLTPEQLREKIAALG